MKRKYMSIFAALAAALALAGYVLAAPPAFDVKKAQQLSPEKRREYDVIFANEMDIWGSNSNRYLDEETALLPFREQAERLGGGHSHLRRVAELRAMAKDGYLPAYVVLRLYDNGYRLQPEEDVDAIRMLIEAAEGGDLSAMCARLKLDYPHPEKAGYYRVRNRLAEQGAERGHGSCLALRGLITAWHFGRMPDGIMPNNTLADVDKAVPDLYEAARQGYYLAHSELFQIRWRQLEERNFQLAGPLDLERILCWGRLANQHSNQANLNSHIVDLRGAYSLGLSLEEIKANYEPYAWPKISKEYLPLLDRYDPAKVLITHKIATPERCLNLERQYLDTESQGDRK